MEAADLLAPKNWSHILASFLRTRIYLAEYKYRLFHLKFLFRQSIFTITVSYTTIICETYIGEQHKKNGKRVNTCEHYFNVPQCSASLNFYIWTL
jgi:hypothetical protein